MFFTNSQKNTVVTSKSFEDLILFLSISQNKKKLLLCNFNSSVAFFVLNLIRIFEAVLSEDIMVMKKQASSHN